MNRLSPGLVGFLFAMLGAIVGELLVIARDLRALLEAVRP